jgi:DNA-binding NtrC family response regulator
LEHDQVAIGRDDVVGATLDDEHLSRHHAVIENKGGRWVVRDLGSHNGTSVEGVQVAEATETRAGAVVRAGGTIVLLAADVTPFAGARVEVRGDFVRGPRFGAVLDAAARACNAGFALFVQGETGTGKELVARAFHAALLARNAPYVAVNCAAIPQGLAESLLFGARRGAYTGSAGDVVGHLHSADGGVLFLDEVGELELAVQAKLLRVLETKEVTPLGSSSSSRVNARFCSATHRDLRAEVAAGRFRMDLLFRLREAEVTVPPLRERREEIPWLVAATLARAAGDRDVRAHPKLVEACMLLPWPGNVRELVREIRQAALRAGDDRVLRLDALDSQAGAPLTSAPLRSPERHPVASQREVEAALARAGGNISAAARALGMHRTQLRRLLAKLGLQSPRG